MGNSYFCLEEKTVHYSEINLQIYVHAYMQVPKVGQESPNYFIHFMYFKIWKCNYCIIVN